MFVSTTVVSVRIVVGSIRSRRTASWLSSSFIAFHVSGRTALKHLFEEGVIHDCFLPHPQEILEELAFGDPHDGIAERQPLDALDNECPQNVLRRVIPFPSSPAALRELPQVVMDSVQYLRIPVQDLTDGLIFGTIYPYWQWQAIVVPPHRQHRFFFFDASLSSC